LAKKLLDQARGIPRTKHYSYRTEQAYLDWMHCYLLFHNKRHPKEMGNPEIQAFLNQLAVEKKGSAFIQNPCIEPVEVIVETSRSKLRYAANATPPAS